MIDFRAGRFVFVTSMLLTMVSVVSAQERRAVSAAPEPQAKAATAKQSATVGKQTASTEKSTTTSVRSRSPDYKVVFWFTNTGWRHQVYDVRKGQYTQAVDDWVNHLEFDESGFVRPGRLATVRQVYLTDETGASDSDKLASAITRLEKRLLIAKDRTRVDFLAHPFGSVKTRADRTDDSRHREVSRPVASGRVGLGSGPSTYLFPTPYPFSRPHP
jgi:hypothetical protein